MEQFKPHVWLKKYKIGATNYYDAEFVVDIPAGWRILSMTYIDDSSTSTRTYNQNITPDAGVTTATLGYTSYVGAHTKPAGYSKIAVAVLDNSGATTVKGKKTTNYNDAEDVGSGGGKP